MLNTEPLTRVDHSSLSFLCELLFLSELFRSIYSLLWKIFVSRILLVDGKIICPGSIAANIRI